MTIRFLEASKAQPVCRGAMRNWLVCFLVCRNKKRGYALDLKGHMAERTGSTFNPRPMFSIRFINSIFAIPTNIPTFPRDSRSIFYAHTRCGRLR
jgi:hypothetical protein